MRDEMLRQVVAVARGVPGVIWQVVVGGFVGGVLGVMLGGLSVTAMHLFGWMNAEGVTGIALGAATVAAVAVGGTYIGALRGCARGLGGLVDRLVLVPKLWTVVKPHVVGYARHARSGVDHAEARAQALRGFRSEQGVAAEGATGIAERAERYVAGLLYGVLVGGLLRGLLGRGAATWEDVESEGLERADDVVGDLIAQLFHGPALVAMFLTVAAAVAPHVVHALAVASLVP